MRAKVKSSHLAHFVEYLLEFYVTQKLWEPLGTRGEQSSAPLCVLNHKREYPLVTLETISNSSDKSKKHI